MTTEKKQEQQGCNVAKLIDMIEMAISAAVAIYGAAEPIIKAILKPDEKQRR